MNSTFARATAGFILLTIAVCFMGAIALWAIERYANGSSWASLIVVLVVLISEISIYLSTLHEPIYDWIKEPKREAERKQSLEDFERREKARGTR